MLVDLTSQIDRFPSRQILEPLTLLVALVKVNNLRELFL
jgi:hypothetical protein